MRSRTAVGVLALLAACDISFVDLRTDGEVAVHVHSHQSGVLKVGVVVWAASGSGLHGVVAAGQAAGEVRDGTGTVEFTSEVLLEPAHPLLELTLHAAGPEREVPLAVPVLVRAGQPRCLAGGDLLIPLAWDRPLAPSESQGWEAGFLGEQGRVLTTIRSDGALPDPLRVSAGLVPSGARDVVVSVTATGPLEAFGPWSEVLLESVVVAGVEEDCMGS